MKIWLKHVTGAFVGQRHCLGGARSLSDYLISSSVILFGGQTMQAFLLVGQCLSVLSFPTTYVPGVVWNKCSCNHHTSKLAFFKWLMNLLLAILLQYLV